MTSSSTSNYHLFTFFLIFLVFVNNHRISANSFNSRSDYQHQTPIYNDLSLEDIDDSELSIPVNPYSSYIPDHEEIISQKPWSQLFHRYSVRSIDTPAYALRRGEIRYTQIPPHKRTIPLEFKKALFAHGIVGRRR